MNMSIGPIRHTALSCMDHCRGEVRTKAHLNLSPLSFIRAITASQCRWAPMKNISAPPQCTMLCTLTLVSSVNTPCSAMPAARDVKRGRWACDWVCDCGRERWVYPVCSTCAQHPRRLHRRQHSLLGPVQVIPLAMLQQKRGDPALPAQNGQPQEHRRNREPHLVDDFLRLLRPHGADGWHPNTRRQAAVQLRKRVAPEHRITHCSRACSSAWG
jgi:hypothetical protein